MAKLGRPPSGEKGPKLGQGEGGFGGKKVDMFIFHPQPHPGSSLVWGVCLQDQPFSNVH